MYYTIIYANGIIIPAGFYKNQIKIKKKIK